MQLNLFQNIVNEIKSIDINKFINEISERIQKMEQELVIDRFEDNFAICEDRKNKTMHKILKSDLPENVLEGSVLKYENGKYVINKEKQEKISKSISEKMNNLWK